MEYGKAGTTPSNSVGHIEGTGGYFELLLESETPFEGYEDIRKGGVYYLPKKDNKYLAYKGAK